MTVKKRRADELLMEKLNLESIELARALIMEGRAFSGDTPITAISRLISENAPVRVKGELDRYVSRGAHKLKKALEAFGINLRDRVCVDVGASTGGFTDVMLRAGARRVYAVDVGYNLLDYRLRSDERVACMERTNARFISRGDFDEKITFGATDVSFISLKAVLPAALSVLEGGSFVALIKPQFEAPKEMVGEKGVVRDPDVHFAVISDIVKWLEGTEWCAAGLDYSPITGPEGNIEFLLYIAPNAENTSKICETDIRNIVCAAYDKFIKSDK